MKKEFLGKVFSVNISDERGTIKYPVGKAEIGLEGVVNDAHYGASLKHVSVISKERIDEFAKEAGREINVGEFAENITTVGIDLSDAKLHDRFKIGEAEIEIIQIGKDEEVDSNKVFRIIGKVVMVHEGLFCKVIKTGDIAVGDDIVFVRKDYF